MEKMKVQRTLQGRGCVRLEEVAGALGKRVSAGHRTKQATGLVNQSLLLETLLSLSTKILDFFPPLFTSFYLACNP